MDAIKAFMKKQPPNVINGWMGFVNFLIQIIISSKLLTIIKNADYNIETQTTDTFKLMISLTSEFWILHNLVGFVMNIFLMRGIYMKKSVLLRPWLISIPIGLFVIIVFFITIAAECEEEDDTLLAVMIVQIYVITAALETCLWFYNARLYIQYRNEELKQSDTTAKEVEEINSA